MIPADDHSTVGRIADEDFAGQPALMKIRRLTVSHDLKSNFNYLAGTVIAGAP
jgi:hypothetical protein